MNRIKVAKELVRLAGHIHEGETVRIKPEFCDHPDEAKDEYVVVEDKGNRLDISPKKWEHGKIIPRETVERKMLMKASRIKVAKELVRLARELTDEKWVKQAFLQVRTARRRKANTMSFEEYWEWLDNLKAGDEVVLRWTAGSFGHYKAKAKLVRVNPKSVVGELTEEVRGPNILDPSEEIVQYSKGSKITLPRDLTDRKFSFQINSPWPPGVDRITKE
jgi:hypothetical protein